MRICIDIDDIINSANRAEEEDQGPDIYDVISPEQPYKGNHESPRLQNTKDVEITRSVSMHNAVVRPICQNKNFSIEGKYVVMDTHNHEPNPDMRDKFGIAIRLI